MKKLFITLAVISATCLFGRAESLIFSNQTITVFPEQLAIESIEYDAGGVVTNEVLTWAEPSTNIVELGMIDGGGFQTNVVQNQIIETCVTTNAARWTCNVIFALPKGHRWELNGFPVSVERFKAHLEIPVDPAVVTDGFGDDVATGLEFAASHGAYEPHGHVKDAFLSFAAAVLAGGQ